MSSMSDICFTVQNSNPETNMFYGRVMQVCSTSWQNAAWPISHRVYKAARVRLLWEKECDLPRAIKAQRISEATQEQVKTIMRWKKEDVNAVSSSKNQVSRKHHNSPKDLH